VIDEFNRESYLSKITHLMKIMEDKDLLSENCQQVARNIFSLDIGISKYFDIYNKVLSGSQKI
jgi:hypothetical protein